MRRSASDVSWEFQGWWWWCKGDQQVAERGEASAAEVTKCLLGSFGYGTIETTEKSPAGGSDPIGAAAAIARIGASHHEPSVSETRHEAREIGIARDHPCADLGARETTPPRRAENAQDVVLRRRETGGRGNRIGSCCRDPGGPDQRDQDFLFERITDRHGGGRRGHVHGGIITPREEYLSRGPVQPKTASRFGSPFDSEVGTDLNSTFLSRLDELIARGYGRSSVMAKKKPHNGTRCGA